MRNSTAITPKSPSEASEQPAEMVARSESAGRLILFAIGWLLLAAFASGAPLGVVSFVLKRNQFPAVSVPVSLTWIGFLACCVLLIAVRRRSLVVGHGNRRAGVGDGPIRRWWLLVVLAIPAATWAFVALAIINAAAPQWVADWQDASPWTLVALAIVMVILAPLAEELFYRGWLWTGLRQHWRPFPTAVLSCSLWLISHIERGLPFLIIIIPAAVILGFARHFCGLRAGIILHAIYNFVTVVGMVSLLLTPSAQWQCTGESDIAWDLQISNCTRAIESGTYKGASLAWAYNNRGNVWNAKDDLDRAIADYNDAIRLDPKYALAYRNRGRAYFYQGSFTAAASDLLSAADLKDDAYTMLWRFLARGHIGQDGKAELSANAARLKAKDWPYPVIDFYLGRRSLEEMRAAAAKPDEQCEAAFYVGEWQLLRGDKAAARLELARAVSTCPKGFIEYTGAVSELKRIGQQ